MFKLPSLHVNDWYAEPHSLAQINRNVLPEMVRRGYEVTLAPPSGAMHPDYMAGYYRFRNTRHPKYCTILHHYQRPHDIYKSQSSCNYIWAAPDSFFLGHTVDSKTYAAYTRMLVYSTYAQEHYREAWGLENTAVVPLGVDRTLYRPVADPIPLEKVFDPGLPGYRAWGPTMDLARCAKILLPGYLQPRKGVRAFVAAFERFWEQNNGPEVVLLIKATRAGWGVRVWEEIESAWKAAPVLYSETPLDDQDFVRLLNAVDAVAQPSHIEGFGLVPLQAMAVGKSVIVTHHSGTTDYATPLNASLIPVETQRMGDQWSRTVQGFFMPEDGAIAIEDCLDHLKSQERAEARNSTADAFTWSRSTDAFIKAIESSAGVPLRKRGYD